MSKPDFQGFWVPLFIFLVALTVRVKPFLYAEHFFLVPTDFDEGVYYGAAILINKGLMPYRDFDFGHPPGIAWILGLWHGLIPLTSVAQSFALAKLAMAVLGSFTTVGIYALGRKWSGVGSGIIASLLYATYPEAIVSERSIFLEPWINATVITALLLYSSRKQSWLPIGLLLAWAVSVKVTAVIWIPAFAVLAWRSARMQPLFALIGSGILGFAIFLLPAILLSPAQFWENVIQFQLSRPPDGDTAISQRLSSIFRDQHLAMNLFTFLGLGSLPWLTGSRRELCAIISSVVAFALLVLLSSKGFWGQYNTLLALPQAVLAIFARNPFACRVPKLWIMALLTMFFLAIPLRSSFKGGRARDSNQWHIIQELSRMPKSSCIFSFEPAWLIMADRFPAPCPNKPILDTYLVMLMDASSQGRAFATTGAAFATNESQVRVLRSLQGADVIAMGERGGYQLNEKSRMEILDSFHSEDGLLYRKE